MEVFSNEIYNLYYCIGSFSSKNKIAFNFYIAQYVDGKIEIMVFGMPALLFVEFYNNDIPCSIEGNIIGKKGNIHITDAHVTNISINSSAEKPTYCKLKVFNEVRIDFNSIEPDLIEISLTNFLNNKTRNGKFIDFNIQHEYYDIEFIGIEDYEYYKQQLYENKLDAAATSLGKISLKNKDINLIKNIDQLTDLLSYCNKTQISAICFNYYNDKTLCKTILRPLRTTRYTNKEKLIEPENIKLFIEKCYPKFLETYYDFSLNIIISIYLESLLNNYKDTAYVLLVQALESFLMAHENYCINHGEEIIPHSIKDISEKLTTFFEENENSISKEDIDKLSEELAYKHTTTNEKLSLLKKKDKFRENLNLNQFDYDFPTIRNKTIHTGKVPETINSSSGPREINIPEEYDRLIYLFDKIILILLEYNGKFNDYLNKNEFEFEN